MTLKCPLCQLSDLQNLEFENNEELVKHCEQYHTIKTLAWSFIENYFAHKDLREKIHEKIHYFKERGQKWCDEYGAIDIQLEFESLLK